MTAPRTKKAEAAAPAATATVTGQRIRYIGVESVEITDVRASEYTANRQDDATYERLKEELQKGGMIELPVLLQNSDGADRRWLAGHHRTRAWAELGHRRTDAVILQGDVTPEEEFNVVNNLNQVRGTTRIPEALAIARAHQLDPTKLDVFKAPIISMMGGAKTDVHQRSDTVARRAKLRDLAIKASAKLAEAILDDLDAAIVVLRIEDKVAAVLQVPLGADQVRRDVSVLKRDLEGLMQRWAAGEGFNDA